MVDLKETIQDLIKKKRSLLAFNIQNIWQLEALYETGKMLDLPVMAQFSSKYISYFHDHFDFKRLISKYQNNKFFFHLDHSDNPSIIQFCIDCGFASVMYDGSHEPVNVNIDNSNKIYKYADNSSLLEVEIGSIGGIEDGFGSGNLNYYNDSDLILFVKNAKFDLLALGIGNLHGEYNSVNGVKIELLEHANQLIGKVPLVLHGGTGLPDDMIFKAIDYGVVKINISTSLKTETAKLISNFYNTEKYYDEMKLSMNVKEGLANYFTPFILKFTK